MELDWHQQMNLIQWKVSSLIKYKFKVENRVTQIKKGNLQLKYQNQID